MEEDNRKIGDGLYLRRGFTRVYEVVGSKYRLSREGSIITRRKRFNHLNVWPAKTVRGMTDFVLPNEFLT